MEAGIVVGARSGGQARLDRPAYLRLIAVVAVLARDQLLDCWKGLNGSRRRKVDLGHEQPLWRRGDFHAASQDVGGS